MTSEVEERPRLITAGYGRLESQWVNKDIQRQSLFRSLSCQLALLYIVATICLLLG